MGFLDNQTYLVGLALGGAAGVIAGLVLLGLFIWMVVDAYKRERSWWIYLVSALLAPIGMILIVAWFVYLRNNQVRLGSTGLSL